MTFVSVILAVAALVRALLGFGEALIAAPLLAFVLPVETVGPLATLVSITVAVLLLLFDWRHVHARSAARLLVPTLAGIPIGLWALTGLDGSIVKGVLALLIASFSAYSLMTPEPPVLIGDGAAPAFGFAAGIMGGAYGMNGPPIVMYGTLRRWPSHEFRATLQGYFLPASTCGLIGYWLAGLWTREVTAHYVAALPGIVAATVGGRMLHNRLQGRRFTAVVHVALIAVAVALLWQSLFA